MSIPKIKKAAPKKAAPKKVSKKAAPKTAATKTAATKTASPKPSVSPTPKKTPSQAVPKKAAPKKAAPNKAAAGKTKTQTQPKSQPKQSPSTGRSLEFKGYSKKLSPQQLKFNRNIKEIARLEKRLKTRSQEFSDLMEAYRTEALPLLDEFRQAHISYLKTLFQYIKAQPEGLTAKNIKVLKALLKEEMRDLQPEKIAEDPELQELLQVVHEKDYTALVEEEMQEHRIEAIDILRENGYIIADDYFDQATTHEEINDLLSAFVQQAYTEMRDQEQQAADSTDNKESNQKAQSSYSWDDNFDDFNLEDFWSGNNRKKRKPTKKQLEAQAKKEQLEKEKQALKQKSISGIYKQLAKIFHPDLEPDPEKRIEKQALMQELTAAYQTKDLHTLLRLELAYISKEESHIEQLAEDRLRVYNEVLSDQIQDLNARITDLKYDPLYQPVKDFIRASEVTMTTFHKTLKNLELEYQLQLEKIQSLKKMNKGSIKIVKTLLKQFEQYEAQRNVEMDLLQMLMAEEFGFDPYDD